MATVSHSSIRSYSVIIYNNNKYTIIIKLPWGKNTYICYNKKYLHEFIYTVMKNMIQSILEEFPKK